MVQLLCSLKHPSCSWSRHGSLRVKFVSRSLRTNASPVEIWACAAVRRMVWVAAGQASCRQRRASPLAFLIPKRRPHGKHEEDGKGRRVQVQQAGLCPHWRRVQVGGGKRPSTEAREACHEHVARRRDEGVFPAAQSRLPRRQRRLREATCRRQGNRSVPTRARSRAFDTY